MKHIKKYLIIFSMIFTFSNVHIHAETEQERILVISELSWYFDVQINENNIQVGFIPNNLYLGYSANRNNEDIKNTIEQFLDVTYTHVLYIDMDKFYQDTKLESMNSLDHNTAHLFKHLHKVSDTISIPMLLQYQSYISSDLNVMDYIRYYKLFNNDNTKFNYAYLYYIIIDDLSIPLDNTLHMKE